MTERSSRTVILLRFFGAGVALALASSGAGAKVHLSQAQALAVAFGDGAAIERKSVILTEAQMAAARAAAGPGVDFPSALVTRYEGRRDGTHLGFAYFDTHVVRTLPESVMIAIGADGAVARVEILVFAEPEDYMPRPRWLEQFRGRRLDRELSLQRGLHGITGATLSARSVTDAVRRALAIHRALAIPNGSPR